MVIRHENSEDLPQIVVFYATRRLMVNLYPNIRFGIIPHNGWFLMKKIVSAFEAANRTFVLRE